MVSCERLGKKTEPGKRPKRKQKYYAKNKRRGTGEDGEQKNPPPCFERDTQIFNEPAAISTTEKRELRSRGGKKSCLYQGKPIGGPSGPWQTEKKRFAVAQKGTAGLVIMHTACGWAPGERRSSGVERKKPNLLGNLSTGGGIKKTKAQGGGQLV